MENTISKKFNIVDDEWGCEYVYDDNEFDLDKIKVCYLKVSELSQIALKLTEEVQDTSWIVRLDEGAKDAYSRTVYDTARELVEVFQNTVTTSEVAKGFGELMVSMGAARALEVVFSHISIPLAELWKPQLRGNEGFDFHTICSESFINFGEAKFQSSSSAFRSSINQINSFLEMGKHKRDWPHLIQIVPDNNAIQNLEKDKFGVVAAFSINSSNPIRTLDRAVRALNDFEFIKNAEIVYLVGVIH